MSEKHDLHITPRDRLMQAWEIEMALVRAYQRFADEITDDKPASRLFSRLAEQECENASRLLDLLHERDSG